MTFLFFDAATTTGSDHFDTRTSYLQNWPRLFQLTWTQIDAARGEVGTIQNHVLKPNGFSIPDISESEGITTAYAEREGEEPYAALGKFANAAEDCDTLVAHNVALGASVVGAEMLRAYGEDSLIGKSKMCTMKTSSELCGLENPYGPKWPSLPELHGELFGTPVTGFHSGRVDRKSVV